MFYQHEAQASEWLTTKLTRLRVVLVFVDESTQMALSN